MSGNVGIGEGCEQKQRWPHSKKVQNLVLAPALRLFGRSAYLPLRHIPSQNQSQDHRIS